MQPLCTRTWAAEAARDGRVSGHEHAAFLAHASQCLACSSQLRRLEQLGRALRALPVDRPDDLTTRRQRQRLLAALDAAAKKPPRRMFRGAIAAGATTLVLIGLALAARLIWRPSALAAPSFVVQVHPAEARWSTHREALTEVVVLEEGSLEIQSAGRDAPHRLVVRVPDGEIEDIGTRFMVFVRSSHTERIDVAEGVVVFRAFGEVQRVVRAGERWSREPPVLRDEPSASRETIARRESVAVAPMTSPPRPGRSAAPEASSAETGARRGKHASLSNRPLASDDDPSVAAGEAFAAAMAIFHRGEFANAALALESFAGAFPSDPRSEDASFLSAVAHARDGDGEGAARLAREYLARYPHGLRRVEAERLANRRLPP